MACIECKVCKAVSDSHAPKAILACSKCYDSIKAERDALLTENQWHLASDIKPPYNVTVMTYGRLGLSFGIWDCNKWYVFDCDDNSTSEWIDFLPTHWRLLPQPPKGQP
jgi:hypothetical protein